MTDSKKLREFWVYQNEPNGTVFVCDFNQRGFAKERMASAIHVVELPAGAVVITREQLEDRIRSHSGRLQCSCDHCIGSMVTLIFGEESAK